MLPLDIIYSKAVRCVHVGCWLSLRKRGGSSISKFYMNLALIKHSLMSWMLTTSLFINAPSALSNLYSQLPSLMRGQGRSILIRVWSLLLLSAVKQISWSLFSPVTIIPSFFPAQEDMAVLWSTVWGDICVQSFYLPNGARLWLSRQHLRKEIFLVSKTSRDGL